MKMIERLKDKALEMIPFKKKPTKKYFQDTNEILDVLMQDGTIEQYPENLHITDGINGAMCEGFNFYHTHLDCPYFKLERSHNKIIAVYRKNAERDAIFQCSKCKEWDELEEEY